MKKTVLALALTSLFSGAALSHTPGLGDIAEHVELSYSYNKIADQISSYDEESGAAFRKYVRTGDGETAFNLVKAAHESGQSTKIEAALKNIYVKSDGGWHNGFDANKALNGADSIIADAAKYARDNNVDVGLKRDELTKIVKERYGKKEDWTNINDAIEANRAASTEIEKAIEARKVNLSKVLTTMKKNNVKVGKDGRISENGVDAGRIIAIDGDSVVIGNDGSTTVIDTKTGDVFVDGWKEGKIIDDTKGPIDPVTPPRPNNPSLVNASDIAKAAGQAGIEVDDKGNITQDGQRVAKVVSSRGGTVAISSGDSTAVIDTNTGKVTVDGEDQNMIIIDDSKQPQPEPEPITPAVNPEKELEEAASRAVIEASDDVDRRIAAAEKRAGDVAASLQKQFQGEINRLDSKIDTMEGRVSNGAAMVGAMAQMQFGSDGLGIGAGVANFNGSNALAIGAGYAFGDKKQWMAKGSLGYAESSKGRGSKDTMAAAGITYSFK